MGQITSLFAHKMLVAAVPAEDVPAYLAKLGLDPAAPWDPKQMIPDTAYYSVLEEVAARIDPTDWPLRTGASMRCDEYGALGLAWKAAPNLLGSLTRVARFARLWTTVVDYTLQEDTGHMRYVLHRTGPRRLGLRLSNETTLASTVALARQVSEGPFVPRAVFFQHPAPKTTDHHLAFFGCPVHFDATEDALHLSPESLARPNRLGDEGITQFLLAHLESELAQAAEDPSLERQTKDAIARALSGGVPKMAEIASGLGMSARSFHRRLAEHGLSFQSLTDTTRRDLAEGLLRDPAYSLADVAFLTGFSEQSAFTRAFKRWMGRTPAQFRKAHRPDRPR